MDDEFGSGYLMLGPMEAFWFTFFLGLAVFDISKACSASEDEFFPARMITTGSEELSEVVCCRH